jgi:hypothetical protein
MHRPIVRASAPSLPLGVYIAAALALLPAAASAQTSDITRPYPIHVISVNPLGLLFSYVSLEYEMAMNGTMSVGGAVTYWDQADDDRDDFRLTFFDGKVRLYPKEAAPGGLSVALTLGVVRIVDKDEGCDTGESCPDEQRSATPFTTGLELGHTWLLGRSQGFALSMGLGARRLHFSGGAMEDVSKVQGIFRLAVGKAF